VSSLYVEREQGRFKLRRGFAIPAGAKIAMVEDIVTTGLSSRECLDAIRAIGAKPVAAACLIDRSGGKAKVGVKLVSLAKVSFPAWDADKLPPHLRDTPGVKPGSRGLA
jgi:orotate phosphoribosyltransferase